MDEEIQQTAFQFVRKVSGIRKPSKANQEAFDEAIDQITLATKNLLRNLVVK